ncbi:predicted protein [Sclerotinia sclerotiorum 1980 UF-70]|uniref:Uncharacterized protein n=1 Tax=Sclerotinia sclerotiorum (strain ATCC 18683 / 1980 / Ss-1) TaxID=665079 RepID=A7E842_SCLS1|nr:predicted protein [Sclerotinia sclerotiorum 1980 UF-70]EDN96544.1 predicted protein [Sclerotinia sclerotiorum 1980 UF-70]
MRCLNSKQGLCEMKNSLIDLITSANCGIWRTCPSVSNPRFRRLNYNLKISGGVLA